MAVTLLVEPDFDGHRFQAVANVAAVAARTSQVRLLTSRGSTARDEFAVYLSDAPLTAEEVFDEVYPSTRDMVAAVAARCDDPDTTVVVMDADQSLKRWWLEAPRAFRRLPVRPRVVFFLTRYPARLGPTDRLGWKLRVSKGALALAAKATGSLDHVGGFAGREDMTEGWLVKRARDPAICGAHSRDRAALRDELGLPADRRLVGIFGGISERKNSRLVLEAITVAGLDDADLVLAGKLDDAVRAWVDGLGEADRARVHVVDGFLTNDLLDRMVAAVDVAPIALTNNGPSGIMGKALAAGVPVVSAGSTVRARELAANGGGETADLTAESIGAALARVLAADGQRPRPSTVPPATAEEFALRLLGVDESGAVVAGRRRRTIRARSTAGN